MKRVLPILGIFGALSGALSVSAWADSTSTQKICVLDYEVPGSPVSKLVQTIFSGHPNVTIHPMAVPIDFAGCIEDGSTEIVIIGHALVTPTDQGKNHPIQLAFFRNLEGDERQAAISSTVQVLNAQIAMLKQSLQANPPLDDDDPIYEMAGPDPRQSKLDTAEDMLKKYSPYPANQPYYIINPVLPNSMSVARADLAAQAAQPGGVKLKRIRLMSCAPQQVLADYSDLTALIKENNIELDVAPTNPILSFFEGMAVTSPDPNWLKQSLQ